MDGLTIQGIFVRKEIVKNEYGGVDNMVVIELKSGEDAENYAKEFEKNYLDLGVQTFDIEGIINTILQITNNMMYGVAKYEYATTTISYVDAWNNDFGNYAEYCSG